MRQEDRSKRTKGLIVTMTESLVREKGCKKVTMNEIMGRTGLSKGAIYHYVKSKNELLALVLKKSIEDIDTGFFKQIEEGNIDFKQPFQEITQSLTSLQNPENPVNQIFVYLLGQSHEPAIQDIVNEFYIHSIELFKRWIRSGQKSNVIPLSVDADKAAELFFLIASGMRLRGFIPNNSYAFNTDDFTALMTSILQPNKRYE